VPLPPLLLLLLQTADLSDIAPPSIEDGEQAQGLLLAPGFCNHSYLVQIAISMPLAQLLATTVTYSKQQATLQQLYL
jgi:hypothetical protein